MNDVIINALAELGWPRDELATLGRHGEVSSDTQPYLSVRHVRRTWSAYWETRFVLFCNRERGEGRINPKTIDSTGARWRSTLSQWITMATFTWREIQAEHAEEDAAKAAAERARAESEAVLRRQVEAYGVDWGAFANLFNAHYDSGVVAAISGPSISYYTDIIDDYRKAPVADQVRRAARLISFLQREKWIK